MFFRFNPINLFKKIVSNNNKNINNIIIYLSYNVIYYITGLQVLCNNSYTLIRPLVLFIHSYTRKNNHHNNIYDVKIITNGIVTLSTNKENVKNNIFDYYNNKNIIFDFLVYSHLTNKVIYKTIPTDYNYNILSYKFINTELITKSKKRICLSFVTSSYNYFIENNFINKQFILYFITAHHKDFMLTLPPDDLNDYIINIIDDKINIIEISSLDTILLKKENYIIN